jgi:threonyl-tRNA synthetase
VLVRSNGKRPGPARAARGRPADPDPDHARHGRPDALAVLRHSTAHLLAEAVRRLYPGTKIAIGPPIENGFYYDFEFPEPIGEEALERIEEEMRKELAEGRSWNREEVDAEEAKRYFAEQGEDYKVELVDTADRPESRPVHAGRVPDLCRGPAPAGLEADHGGQADRPRGRTGAATSTTRS